DGARNAYQKAIATDPKFAPAQINLAKLDRAEGNDVAARDRLLALLKVRPKDTVVMVELAQIEDSAGNTAEATRWLEKAHALERRNTKITARLIELQLRTNNVDAALSIANDARNLLPDNLETLSSYGQASFAAGKLSQANAAFERIETLAGSNATWLYQAAAYQAN